MAVTHAQVKSWFVAAGIPVATATESEDSRIRRLTEAINSGARSESSVLASINYAAETQSLIGQVQDIFDRFSVPVEMEGETAQQRLARIAGQVQRRERTLVGVTASVRGIADRMDSREPAAPSPVDTPDQMSFFEQAKLLFPFIPDALIGTFAEKWEEFGSRDLALQAMRQDPRYNNFFPGIKREDGSLRMTEQEYLSTVESYKRQLGQFGVPVSAVLNQGKVEQLIRGEVSAQEFGQRVSQAYTQLVTNIDQVREFYATNFGAGGLSDAALFASALDPGRSPLEFQREIEQAHIGGEAAMRGFGVDVGETARLQSLGLDQVAARRLFGQAQGQLPRLNELLTRFNDPDDEVTLEEFSDAVVISDPEQMRQFGRLFGRSSASFSPTGRVSMDRSGALAGLLER